MKTIRTVLKAVISKPSKLNEKQIHWSKCQKPQIFLKPFKKKDCNAFKKIKLCKRGQIIQYKMDEILKILTEMSWTSQRFCYPNGLLSWKFAEENKRNDQQENNADSAFRLLSRLFPVASEGHLQMEWISCASSSLWAELVRLSPSVIRQWAKPL